jgi:nucleoside-diphosphate-sugar epimerase
MSILVTGATGFLGSHIVQRLVDNGEQVIVLVRHTSSLERLARFRERITVCVLDEAALDHVFESRQVDTIIHCATNYGRRQSDLLEIIESNLMLPLKLLQLACRYGVRCFVNADTILDKQVSQYALTKSQFREWLQSYQSSLVCVNVALEHFYGAGDDPGKFVSYVVRQLLNGVARIELTAGEQKRDFIHIDDVVSAFQAILAGTAADRPGYHAYQVGTGKTVTIRSCVEMIQQITGATGTYLDFGALPYRDHEVMESVVDTDTLHALGWVPKISLQEGLERMIAEEREMKKS